MLLPVELNRKQPDLKTDSIQLHGPKIKVSPSAYCILDPHPKPCALDTDLPKHKAFLPVPAVESVASIVSCPVHSRPPPLAATRPFIKAKRSERDPAHPLRAAWCGRLT